MAGYSGLVGRLRWLLSEVDGGFRRCRGGGAPPSLSYEGESEIYYSGGGPPSESEPPQVLAACRERVRTVGSGAAGASAYGVAAGIRPVAAEAKVRVAEAVRPRIGSGVGWAPPSSLDKDELLACVSLGHNPGGKWQCSSLLQG